MEKWFYALARDSREASKHPLHGLGLSWRIVLPSWEWQDSWRRMALLSRDRYNLLRQLMLLSQDFQSLSWQLTVLSRDWQNFSRQLMMLSLEYQLIMLSRDFRISPREGDAAFAKLPGFLSEAGGVFAWFLGFPANDTSKCLRENDVSKCHRENPIHSARRPFIPRQHYSLCETLLFSKNAIDSAKLLFDSRTAR